MIGVAVDRARGHRRTCCATCCPDVDPARPLGVAAPAAPSPSRSADGLDPARAGPPGRARRPAPARRPSASASCAAGSPTTCTRRAAAGKHAAHRRPGGAGRTPTPSAPSTAGRAPPATASTASRDAGPARSWRCCWHRSSCDGWWEPTRRLIEQAPERVVMRARLRATTCAATPPPSPRHGARGARTTTSCSGPWLGARRRARARRQRDPLARLVRLHRRPHLGIQGMLNMVWVLRSGLANPRCAYLPIDPRHARGARCSPRRWAAAHLPELDVRRRREPSSSAT